MHEVIVVGAGPAGALTAMILARAGARVRVFERARFPRHKLCGDTINPGALHILARYVSISEVLHRGLALQGMLLTGPGRVQVRGRYGPGLTGRSIARRELDALLIGHAVAAGAAFEDGVVVTAPIFDGSTNVVAGVEVKGRSGTTSRHRARIVIAADGRESRLARSLGLARHPRHPRRWAIGAYFEGVEDLDDIGEMHVRPAHYIGVAPMPDGLANACLVVPQRSGDGPLNDPAAALRSVLAADPLLAARFARARRIDRVHVLGPMAVDATAGAVPGLLMAGDAAGFIDPMTGDGLRFALSGAELAAAVAADVLSGRLDQATAVERLTSLRRARFAAKWRFNRALRALVGSAPAVAASAVAARVIPAAFEAIIRYAGDCTVSRTPDAAGPH